MSKNFLSSDAGRLCQIALIALALPACSGRRVDGDVPASSTGSSHENSDLSDKDRKIENLTSALSRAQSRIEELDAKLAALSDKVDSTRLTVDNLSGSKPIKTVAVGSAKSMKDAEPLPSADDEPAEAKHAENAASSKMTAAESKMLLKMDSAISDFLKAMNLFKGGKYADAELGFNHFTEQYPEHVLAGSAQYYAGESYLMMGEYKLAVNEYGKVISSFASSPRVASAMVRLAQCYEHMGNTAESARTMALARDLFEGSPALDAALPSAKGMEKKSAKKADLDASPMEPGPKDKHAKSQHDDGIDDLEKEAKPAEH